MLHVLVVFALCFYAGASLHALFSLRGALRPKERKDDKWSGYLLFKLGLLCHTIAAAVWTAFQPPMQVLPTQAGDFYFWLSWLLAVIFWAIGKPVRFSAIGGMLSAVILFFLVSSSLLVHTTPTIEFDTIAAAPVDPPHLVFLLLIHVVPAVCANALVILSACVSLIFMIQEKRLKEKRIDFTQKGPNLELLFGLNEAFLFYGFVAMTIAIISGALWAYFSHTPLVSADPLQWISWAAWILLAGILHGATHLKWARRQVALGAFLVGALSTVATVTILFFSRGVFHGA